MCDFKDGREFAISLDKSDKLASFKQCFYVKKGQLYFDGNSLGLCSKDAEEAVLDALNDWKELGINIWSNESNNYFLYQDKLGAMLAPLIKAEPEEVTVCTNTTINIHQAVATFYKPTATRNKILMDDLNFPTDRYAVYSQIKLHGYNPEDSLKIVESKDGVYIDEEAVIEAMTEDVCMVLLPAVLYRSAQLLNLKRLTEEAHKRGIIIGFDLCHSIGIVPHDFGDIQPDFAVWCNYKYLSGGPGAIAGLYINKRHFDMEPGLAGWQGNRKDTQFNLEQYFEHCHNAGGWQTGTQSILSMAPLEGALRIYNEAGIENIREKSLKITAYLMYLIDTKLSKYGFSVGNPRNDEIRGGHVALVHEDAIRINAAMKATDIIPDFRFPNVIRLAPQPLYISYEDVYELVERIIEIMETRYYENFENKRGTVA